jgi:hypothetical protein
MNQIRFEPRIPNEKFIGEFFSLPNARGFLLEFSRTSSAQFPGIENRSKLHRVLAAERSVSLFAKGEV